MLNTSRSSTRNFIEINMIPNRPLTKNEIFFRADDLVQSRVHWKSRQ